MDSRAPLGHQEIMTAMAGILLAIMLSALDQTIVNPALTAISTDLHALDRLSWIIVAYFLTATALTPIYGKLSDIYGRGRLMLIAIALFVAASVFCASAQTLTQLVVARALQGIGGGGLVVVSQAMIADFISPRERGRYQAYVASMWAFAGIAGPPVGGLLADHVSWRWIFWINIPLGILALALCRRAAAKLVVPARRSSKLDLPGALLLIPGVSLLLVWTSEARTAVWTPAAFLPLAFGIAFAGAFVVQELRASEPILPPRLYRNRVILVTNVVGFLLSLMQYSALVLLPVFFQLIDGMGAAASGLMIVPMLTAVPIASTVVGQIMVRTGRYKPVLPCAFALMAVAFAFFSVMGAQIGLPAVICAVGLLGFGVGACGPVLMTATQNAAEARDIGAATSSVTFSRALGASFGTAMFWTILLAPLSAASPGSAQALFRFGRAALLRLDAAEANNVLTLLRHGFHEVFALAAGVAAVTFGIALLLEEEPLKTSPMTSLATSTSPPRPSFSDARSGRTTPQ